MRNRQGGYNAMVWCGHKAYIFEYKVHCRFNASKLHKHENVTEMTPINDD